MLYLSNAPLIQVLLLAKLKAGFPQTIYLRDSIQTLL